MNEVWALVIVALPLVAIWLYMLVEALVREDLSWPRRILWVGALLLLPMVALAAYIVVRPPKAVQVDRGSADCERAEQIVQAAEARQRGAIDDEEYARRIGVEVA
jgi:uncharacterized membrane protein